MRRIFLGISFAALACSSGFAATAPEHPAAYDEFIAKQAAKHGVPERLVHRIVMRESRYNPGLVHNHCFGMMQIKYGTARSMGYKGAPQGLLNPQVNMTYAIPYLANAYRVADGDEDRAVRLFAGGYYYAAKQKQLLAELRTADSPPVTPEPPPPARNPDAGPFAFLQGAPAQPAPQVSTVPAAAEPAEQSAATAFPAASTRPAAAPICNPAVASLAQDGAEPAPQIAETVGEPAPHARGGKRHEKSIARERALKVAQKPAAKTDAAVASAEPPAQPENAAKASPPKAKVAKAHAKTLVVAGARSKAVTTVAEVASAQDGVEPTARDAGASDESAAHGHAGKVREKSAGNGREPAARANLAVAASESSGSPADQAKISLKPARKAKDAKARAKSIAVAAAKSPALATADAGTQTQSAKTADSAQ